MYTVLFVCIPYSPLTAANHLLSTLNLSASDRMGNYQDGGWLDEINAKIIDAASRVGAIATWKNEACSFVSLVDRGESPFGEATKSFNVATLPLRRIDGNAAHAGDVVFFLQESLIFVIYRAIGGGLQYVATALPFSTIDFLWPGGIAFPPPRLLEAMTDDLSELGKKPRDTVRDEIYLSLQQIFLIAIQTWIFVAEDFEADEVRPITNTGKDVSKLLQLLGLPPTSPADRVIVYEFHGRKYLRQRYPVSASSHAS